MLVEAHDVAGSAIPRDAHGFLQQSERAFTLATVKVGQAHTMTASAKGECLTLVLDRKASGFALFRRKRREKGLGSLEEGPKRDARPFAREETRHDGSTLGDTPEGLGKRRAGAIEHGLEPWRHIKGPDCRRRLSLPQLEVRCLSRHFLTSCIGLFRAGSQLKSLRVRHLEKLGESFALAAAARTSLLCLKSL